ncbi:MAG: hypothetical protein OXT63_04575 [Gemmatimonadota bacterium]|nr:hypothetical protein [Gemmatimonadota bacterium]
MAARDLLGRGPENGPDGSFVGFVPADERLAHVTANTGQQVDMPAPDAAVLWSLGFEVSDGVMVRGKEDRSLQRARWRPTLPGTAGYEWRGDFPCPRVFVYLLRIEGGGTVAACVAASRPVGFDMAREAWERTLEEAAADGLPTPAEQRGTALAQLFRSSELLNTPSRPWLLTALHPDVINDTAAALWIGDWARRMAWSYAVWERYENLEPFDPRHPRW